MRLCQGSDNPIWDKVLNTCRYIVLGIMLLTELLMVVLILFMFFSTSFSTFQCVVATILLVPCALIVIPFIRYEIWQTKQFKWDEVGITLKTFHSTEQVKWDRIQQIRIQTINMIRDALPRKYFHITVYEESDLINYSTNRVPYLWEMWVHNGNLRLIRFTEERADELGILLLNTRKGRDIMNNEQ